MKSEQATIRWKTDRFKFLMGLLIIIISLIAILTCKNNESDKETSIPPHECRIGDLYIPAGGFVPDSVTAIRIAEAIWLPIYGNHIYENKPFEAELVGDSLWIVVGSLPKNVLGGVPYIEILKKDGKILGVEHGK